MAQDRHPSNYIIRSVNRFVADGEGQKLAKLLASKRLVVDSRQLDGPLLDAARLGRERCVQPLLDAGADPNATDQEGRGPLHLVMEKGGAKPAILKMLLKAGGSPNKPTYTTHQTPFHVACRRGLQVCVQLLIGAGAHVDKGDAHGNTPLLLSAKEGHFTVMRMLLLEGANPNRGNRQGETALHFVTRKGNHDTVMDLLTCRADPDLQDYKGQTSLIIAAKTGNMSIAQALIEHGTDLHMSDLEMGRTALHWTIANDNIKLAGLLIQAGADLNAKDRNWQTPFMLALTTGRTDTVQMLLHARCDVTITDKARNTSLHLAARDGRNELIRPLVKAGICVDIKGAGGATPLMLAAYGGHVSVVQNLVHSGADPDLGDRQWATAIMYAMFSKAENVYIQGVVKELIRANCNVNKATHLLKFAQTLPVTSEFISQLEDRMYRPVEAALLRGKLAVFMFLLKAGCDVSGVQGDKLLMQTYLYDAGVSPKHRRMMLRYLHKEQTRVKSLLELCRKPARESIGLRGFSRRIERLPVSDQLKQYLKYEDLDFLEQELTGAPRSSAAMAWGSTMSLSSSISGSGGSGSPLSPGSRASLSPSASISSGFRDDKLNPFSSPRFGDEHVRSNRRNRVFSESEAVRTPRNTHGAIRSSRSSPHNSRGGSISTSPTSPGYSHTISVFDRLTSPNRGNNAANARQRPESAPAHRNKANARPLVNGISRSVGKPLRVETEMLDDYSEPADMDADFFKYDDILSGIGNGNDTPSRHNSKTNLDKWKSFNINLKPPDEEFANNNSMEDLTDEPNSPTFAKETNNNLVNGRPIPTNRVAPIRSRQHDVLDAAPLSPATRSLIDSSSNFSRSNPLRHTISRIPRSTALHGPKSPVTRYHREETPASPTSTDSTLSSFSHSTEEDFQSDKNHNSRIIHAQYTTSSNTRHTSPNMRNTSSSSFSRSNPLRRTFNTTRSLDRPGTYAQGGAKRIGTPQGKSRTQADANSFFERMSRPKRTAVDSPRRVPEYV